MSETEEATPAAVLDAVLHRHPRDIYADYLKGRNVPVHVARVIAASFGTWQFGLFYLILTALYVVWNTFWHGPDPFPYMLYTMSVSVLAILMSNLILLASNYQERMDRSHRENAYDQTREILTIQKEQIEILRLLTERLPLHHDPPTPGIAPGDHSHP